MKRARAALAVSALAGVMVIAPAAPAQAADQDCSNVDLLGSLCLNIVDGQAVVTGPLGPILQLPVPIQQVPIYVNVPGPTVSVPGATITVPGSPAPTPPTITRTVPGPTVTITQRGDGTTATVTAPPTTAPAATATTTVTATKTQAGAPPSGPPTARQDSNSSGTLANRQAEPAETNTVFRSIPQALTISLLAVLLGALGVLLILFLVYRAGRAEGERSVDAFMTDLRDFAFTRKQSKHSG